MSRRPATREGHKAMTDDITKHKENYADKVLDQVVHLKRKLSGALSEKDAALARVKELEAAQQWRTIESAPKDGTWFLGYFGHLQIGAIPCHYSQDIRIGHEGEHFYGMFGVGELYGDQFILWPTHWMPLPAPPETGDK